MKPARSRTSFFSNVRLRLSASQIVSRSFESFDSSAFLRQCAGMIFAESEEEVAHVIKAANRWSIPIDPISTGLNVGYGDFFPERSSHIVLNLNRMNRILELNREEGWIRLEPGVSQGEVAEYLQKHAPEFHFDQTYWLKESSVIGNALERGRTLMAERERDLIGAKLVLGSGEVIRTGFDPTAASPLIHGLNLHPLIFQSNLGVVIEGMIRLRRLNASARYYLLGFHNYSEYAKANAELARFAGVRPLRWFCRETFRGAPIPMSMKMHFRECSGGVLAVEVTNMGNFKRLVEVLPQASCPIRRSLLMTPPPIDIAQQQPISFYSFSVRRSPAGLRDAQMLETHLRRRFRMRFYRTISYLDSALVVLLRVQADPAQQPARVRDEFRSIAAEIQKSGYVLFRDHSGIPTKNLPDAKLKKMIKTCFDPRGIISPGRYGIR